MLCQWRLRGAVLPTSVGLVTIRQHTTNTVNCGCGLSVERAAPGARCVRTPAAEDEHDGDEQCDQDERDDAVSCKTRQMRRHPRLIAPTACARARPTTGCWDDRAAKAPRWSIVRDVLHWQE
jgi:hypothetical protein